MIMPTIMLLKNQGLKPVFIAVYLCLICVTHVRADVVAVRGRPASVSTQIVRLADGQLIYQNIDGNETAVAIEQVDYLQITDWQMFNLAEQQRRAKEWRRAVVSYEKVLIEQTGGTAGASTEKGTAAGAEAEKGAAAGTGAVGGLDRRLLAQVRLVQANDELGRFERALEVYLEAVERMPALAEPIMPKQLPQTGSAWLEQADKRIDLVIARHSNEPLGKVLREWKQRWPRPVATAPAVDGLLGTEVDPRMREEIRQVARQMEAGQNAEALARISVLQMQARGGARAELYYWQGRALQAMAVAVPGLPTSSLPTSRPADAATDTATTTNSEQASDKPDGTRSLAEIASPNRNATLARAGLAYMRVVVHFGGHELAPECLYRAGLLCRLAGREQQAHQLWMELINGYPKAHGSGNIVWADKAKEELK